MSAHGLSEEVQAFLNLETPTTIEDLMKGAIFAVIASEYGIEDAMSILSFGSNYTSSIQDKFSAENAPKQAIDLVA